MRRTIFYIIITVGVFLIFTKSALAVCPICTIAVGAGVGFSRWLGIDDAISGLWIGGLIVSMIEWTLSWFQKKNIKFKGISAITALGYYLLVIIPLYWSKFLGNPQNSLICFCGINFDKLLLGIIAGSVSFYFGATWYFNLKEKNQGHAYFPFQKVVMPILPLIILSIIYYFLTK